MAALINLISKVKVTIKSLKRSRCGGRTTRSPQKWVLEIHARAKDKVWPFNTPEAPEADEWFYDGERYRRRGEEPQRTEQQDRKSTQNQAGRQEAKQREAQQQQPPPQGKQQAEKSAENIIPEAPRQHPAEPLAWGPIYLVCAGEKHLFEEISILGKGGEGTVCLFVSPSSCHKIAGKVMDFDMIRGECRMPKEYIILNKHLKHEAHPNIVRVHACYLSNKTAEALVAMEYCAGGSVEDKMKRLQRTRKPVPMKFPVHFIASMAEALGYLHAGLRWVDVDGERLIERNLGHQPVMHRDIKLGNILLRTNPTGMPDVVLADFGGAQLMAKSQRTFGTPGYYPPEVPAAEERMPGPGLEVRSVMTPASDIYALGVCVSRLLCCGRDVTNGGLAGAYEASGLGDTAFSFDLLQRCLSVNAEARPSAEKLFLTAGRM